MGKKGKHIEIEWNQEIKYDFMKNVNMISTCFHETKENKKVVTEVQRKVFFKKKVKQILK